MDQTPLYPLRFEPIFQYRLWGGRRLSSHLSGSLPGDGPIGEAWLLSDRDEHPSIIANGPLKGQAFGPLLRRFPVQFLGKLAGRFPRFPLLLKFLDVLQALSVQVHPTDRQTSELPEGESGKTEAWVVLEAGAKSRIFAGLTPGTTGKNLRQALGDSTVAEHLASFTPAVGDAVLIPAGTVHSLSDVVVFEIQENSDVTFRLYDWDHIDARTDQPRPLQVDQAMTCIDFAQVVILPVTPVTEERQPVLRERLFFCEHFGVWRIQGESSFVVGVSGSRRVLACLAGEGRLEHDGADYPVGKGDVVLLPACLGACSCHPKGDITLLEISLPEKPLNP